jgi:type II secretory ATPase GspE/PulE/Tfp pilus assembly ATPase PilB-like protein
MSQIQVEIISPTDTRMVPLGTEPLTIGRHSKNKIVLEDGAASRFHAALENTSQGVLVRDLNSSNGTLVNGEKVRERLLTDGDLIRIGKIQINVLGLPTKKVSKDTNKSKGQPPKSVNEEMDVLDDELLDPVNLEELEEIHAVDDLSDEDVIDDLGAGDLVEPLTADDLMEGESTTDLGQFAAVLQGLIDATPEPRVQQSDMALMNARGQVVHPSGAARKASSHSDAVETLRAVLVICLKNRATDMHLEPKSDHYQVRVRVDGVMVEIVRVAPPTGVRIAALVKVLSDIDIAQRNSVQEGHFSAIAPTLRHGRLSPQPHRIDYRVSFAPTMHGQKMVIRILDATNAPLKLGDLQLPPAMEQTLSDAIQQESGMVLVCGPTGSGKTTSLYSLIRTIDVSQLNVMTIEDPVEIELPGVTQIPVDEASGRTFSALLRSLLRQDPDVMLVGEVRDQETARIAMQAAITGHMVFSTLHTKDSIGTIFRLLDLGVEPYLVAQALNVVLAQRLARQLCPYCKVAKKPTAEQSRKLEATVGHVAEIFVPQGCIKCLNTGFNGRRAFFELMSVNDALRDVIQTQPSLEEIRKVLAGTAFTSLEHNGHLLIAEGVASFEEIDRSTSR